MKSDSHRDNVIVMVSDPSRLDLEWVLPLIDELASDKVNLLVFDSSAPIPFDHSNYWVRALRLIGQEPIYSPDMEPIPKFLARFFERLRSSTTYAISAMGAVYYSPKSPFNMLFPFTKWREARRKERLVEIISSAKCVFARHFTDDRPLYSFEGEFLNVARECGVPVIGYPLVVDHIGPKALEMRCEYSLANTPEQAKTLNVPDGTDVIPVTPPKFTKRWLKRIADIHEGLAGRTELPEDRKRVLVIMKNDKSPSWAVMDFHDTTRQMIDRLLADGYFLVLKPHPRASRASLERLVEGLNPDDYCVADGALLYWAQRVDRVVSLFSGGSLDALAVGKVPVLWWPLTKDYLEAIRVGKVRDTLMTIDDKGNLSTRYTDFCHQITDPTFDPPVSLDDAPALNRFRSLYLSAPDCRETKAVMAAITDEPALVSRSA